MDAESPEEPADVVPDRLGAQVELGGDLLRRAALLEKAKYLDLTGREMRGRHCGLVVGESLEQPEDADHPFTAHERHRADLHGHPRAGRRNQDAGRIRGRGGAEHLPREVLAGAPAVLGRDDGGEVATANVAEKPLGCRIDPPDDSRRRRGRSSGRRRSPEPARRHRRVPGQWPSTEVSTDPTAHVEASVPFAAGQRGGPVSRPSLLLRAALSAASPGVQALSRSLRRTECYRPR